MRKLILIYSLLLITLVSVGAEIKLTGNYYNENLYIDNPSVGAGFCVTQVLVNGKKGPLELSSNTFEIDLSLFQLQEGDAVAISITHQEGCEPIVLNPKALIPKCSNQIFAARFDKKNSEVQWSGVKENCNLPYYVEQYKWDKWFELGKVDGKASADTNKYNFKVALHSDANLFRVRQVTPRGEEIVSADIKARSIVKEITILLDKEGNNILFSLETNFEIYNQKSELLKSGKASSIDITDLKKDVYIVCYDNSIVQVVKNK